MSRGTSEPSVTGMPMLVIGFWGLSDPLTTASLMPTVRLLLAEGHASHVWLATVERKDLTHQAAKALPEGVTHVPLSASTLRPAAMARAWDLAAMPLKLWALVRAQRIGCIVARSTMAGTIAHPLHVLTKVPFLVESVEPHTDYMVECGAWNAAGPFARVTRWSEGLQFRSAAGLMPVTHRFALRLQQAGVPKDRLEVVPCPVDTDAFAFRQEHRNKARKALGWTANEVVGVYLGKFGGLYHDVQAYRALATFVRYFGRRARLLVLTPMDREVVIRALSEAGVPHAQMHVDQVAHEQVPGLLCAADMAFALYRGTPSSAYLSPVKNGEYWANGLPVLMTRGVSDDSALIERDPLAGALFDPEGEDLVAALQRVEQVIQLPDQRMRTMAFAREHRGMQHLRAAYASLMSKVSASTK